MKGCSLNSATRIQSIDSTGPEIYRSPRDNNNPLPPSRSSSIPSSFVIHHHHHHQRHLSSSSASSIVIIMIIHGHLPWSSSIVIIIQCHLHPSLTLSIVNIIHYHPWSSSIIIIIHDHHHPLSSSSWSSSIVIIMLRFFVWPDSQFSSTEISFVFNALTLILFHHRLCKMVSLNRALFLRPQGKWYERWKCFEHAVQRRRVREKVARH